MSSKIFQKLVISGYVFFSNYVPTTYLMEGNRAQGGKFPAINIYKPKKKKRGRREKGGEGGKRKANNYNVN